ncbi:hypothetical protein DCC62_07450 [candidate division KSB1 bacterium]|nr:MAG: hypothetical protein DCC62_07450 [candidate division KSB1 bacterium]
MSVYLDDFASGATIFGNIFYKAGRAVFMGGGRDHLIENNILVESSPSIFLDARGLVRNTEFFDGRITTLTDRMKDMNYTQPPYSEKYPELLTLYNDDPARPKYNRIRRNISVGGRWLDLYREFERENAAVAEKFEQLGNKIIAGDPGFADMANADFRLRDGSPALKLGFEKIPIDKIGLYIDAYRTSLPDKAGTN